jgi:hypothetical protein
MTLSAAERPIDRGLAKAGLTHDLGDSLRAPELLDFFHHLLSELGLNPEADAPLLCLRDTIELTFAPDVADRHLGS